MKRGYAKNAVGQIAVDVFRGSEDRMVFRDMEVDLKKSEIEYSTVPDEGHDSQERRDEYQCVQQPMHRLRHTTVNGAYIGGQRRGRVPHAPPEPGNEQKPQQQTDERMHVDPVRLRSLR